MNKITENITIRSFSNSSIEAIQSKGDFDYIELFELKNNKDLNFCITTDKFLSVVNEGLTKIDQGPNSVTLYTRDGEYRLPILKERGIFLVKPPVQWPSVEVVKEEWTDDFSDRTVDSKVSANSISKSAGIITIGPGMVARAVNASAEVYGDAEKALLSITQEQYTLIQKLGEAKFQVYEKGHFRASNGVTEVRIGQTKPALAIKTTLGNLTSGPILFKADLTGLKLKTLTKFIFERINVIFKTGSIAFVSETARKVYELPDLVLDQAISTEVWSKDLKYIFGQIEVYSSENNGKKLYIIKSTEKEKTAYLLVMATKEWTW